MTEMIEMAKYVSLQQEYEEFRKESRLLEDDYELTINQLKEELSVADQEANVMKTKRRKELQEHASEVETMEKQRDDAEEELTRVRERLRVAEVEAEGNAREIRRLGAEATRALAAVEELREEVVVLQGERAEAQTVLQEATRASDHLRRELNEARTAVPGAAGAAGKKLPIVDPQKSYQLFAALQKALSDASQLEQDWGKVYTSISKHMKNQWEVPCRQSGA